MRGTKASLGVLLAASLLPAAVGAAAIQGRVRAGDSTTAVANATVVLTRPGGGGGGGGLRTPVDTVRTDAQGAFGFTGVAAGDNYGVTVSAAGFLAYTNNNVDLAADTSVAVLTINLSAAPPPAAISGTVVGADSTTPLANATVVLTGTGTGGGFVRTPLDTLQTDAQGKFAFPGLAAAQNYGLTVSATGFQTYTNNNIDLAGRDTTLTIRLVPPPPPGTINGTVLGADSATAVASATVVLNRPAGGGGGGGGGARTPVDTVQTDAQGKFTFPGVAAGQNYGLVVTATGFQPYTNNNVDLDGGDTATVNVRLLPPGPPGTIAGTVRGPAGPNAAPIANASVVLRGPLAAGGLPLDTVQTNAQGLFTFPTVPSMDNYVVTVTAAGFNVATNNNVDVDSSDTATVNFTLTTTSSVFRGFQGSDLRMTWTDGSLAIRFPALPGPLVLSAYGLDGARLFHAAVPAAGGLVRLPGRAAGPGSALVLSGAGGRVALRLPSR